MARVRRATGAPKIVRARSPFAWLRPVLLFVGLLAIAAVVVMLAAYRFGRAAEIETEAAAKEQPLDAEGERVLSGEGFDYTQTSEGVPVFRIRAQKSRQDRDGTAFLDTVTLDIYREDGETYTVTSRDAVFNEDSWQAKLSGDVLLRGLEGLELEARALELHHGGHVLKSSGEVEFRFPPDLVGRAANLQVDRRNDTITLAGGVHLHTVPGAERSLRLDGDRLVYQRSGALMRVVGDVTLTTEASTLSAHYLTLFLKEDLRTLEMVRARWRVRGKISTENEWGGVTKIDYRAEFLELRLDNPQQADQRAKLDGEGSTVSLKVTDPSGFARTFTGLYLRAQARQGRLVQLEGIGQPMSVLETIDLEEPYPMRQLCADRITAGFAEGELVRIQLERRVELTDRNISLVGGRSASLNLEDGMFRIQGQDKDEVILLNDRAEVRAEQFTYARRTGLIRAYNSVRAVLAEESISALSKTPLGGGSGPIQVESEEAYWTMDPAPPTFAFEGEVRAWRGDSLLLADQLLGDDAQQRLSANGRVRTVWATPVSAGANGAPAAQAPIEVDSELLSYLRDRDQLVYDGGVELRQGGRTISCRKLAVELAAGGRAERMICQDQVRMADAASGRRAQGDRAVYTLGAETIEIFGDEVKLIDAGNNSMQGRYLVYDLATDKFRLSSRVPAGVTESP